MKNPNELVSPDAVFLSISEVGKLFSPPISRQKLRNLMESKKLPLVPLRVEGRIYYYKHHTIELILQLCETDMNYDLDASL